MRKKLFLPLLTTTILLGALFVSQPTFAESTLPDGTTIWLVDELIDLDAEAVAELMDTCMSINCPAKYYEQVDRGGKYYALDSFRNNQFTVTAINPEQSTMRVYLRSTNWNAQVIGYTFTNSFSGVYIMWLDPDYETTYERGYPSYYYDAISGEDVEGVHPILYGGTSIYGDRWIPADQEVNLVLPDAELYLNDTNTITFMVELDDAGGDGGSYDTYDYSECINSPDYVPGMECRLAFDADMAMHYVPVWPSYDRYVEDFFFESRPTFMHEETGYGETTEPIEPIEDSEDIVSGNAESTSEVPVEAYAEEPTENSTEEPVSDANTTDTPEPDTDDREGPLTPTISPTAPNTGSASRTKGAEELPWWIFPLFIVSHAIIKWLLW